MADHIKALVGNRSAALRRGVLRRSALQVVVSAARRGDHKFAPGMNMPTNIIQASLTESVSHAELVTPSKRAVIRSLPTGERRVAIEALVDALPVRPAAIGPSEVAR